MGNGPLCGRTPLPGAARRGSAAAPTPTYDGRLLAYVRKWLSVLSESFWLIPGLMTLLGILGAVGLLALDRNALVPTWLLESQWVYNGGGTGARTLLGAVAGSAIGVAGTVFSITIAALSLAAAQMGPRLMRSFTHDRGVQVTMGSFLGTFSFALMVLRSVRTQDEGMFTPHLALTTAILLGFLCVGMLVYFVGHMAGRINVDTVVDLVSEDVGVSMRGYGVDEPGAAPPPPSFWRDASVVVDERNGYLQQFDPEGLADWAHEHGTVMRLLVRPGDYIFPGAPIALLTKPVDGADAAIRARTALGMSRVTSADPEFTVRQLVEVAVRALSPGINDPYTAISVLDRLGGALCGLSSVHLPTGVHLRDGHAVLVMPSVSYAGLADAMFHVIRQNAAGSVAVPVRMLEVLSAVASCEHDSDRVAALRRHARLVIDDAERSVATPEDLADLRLRYEAFERMTTHGPLASIIAMDR